MKDFFGQQEQAKRNTSLLVLMFVCAVILIVFSVYLAVTAGLLITQVFIAQQTDLFIHDFWDVDRFLWINGVTLMIVAAGSMYRTHQLKQGGGSAVAALLAAKRVPSNSLDPLHSRLLNIVEEMAIASGMPVPPVYLLSQSGINAFAAGFGPRDAVITVSQGAVELLSRDELQGVIAHEFSHILNGDIALKMRLMGLLFGITLISDCGIVMMTARGSSRHYGQERGTHPAMLVMGFMIFMVGTIGSVFADMIKRAVSRQREFLADAAAVQFTRNPEGIAGALKVIGGYASGSRIQHAATQQTSHFFFCNAVKSWENKNWWATHPPLIERIKRLEPDFNGHVNSVDAVTRRAEVMSGAMHAFDAGQGIASGLVASADALMLSIGKPDGEALQHARHILTRMPKRVTDFAHDSFTARAVMYALLLDSASTIRKGQMNQLQKQADASVFRELLDIQPLVAKLDAELRIPLLEMLIPALKSLSRTQFDTFRGCISSLIRADQKTDLFEYMLQRMLLRHLYPSFLKAKPLKVCFDAPEQVIDQVAELIVLLIDRGRHVNPVNTFKLAMSAFHEGDMADMPVITEGVIHTLDEALKKLERSSPALKRRLLKACVVTVLADGNTAIVEIELVRAIADALDVPVPPFDRSTT